MLYSDPKFSSETVVAFPVAVTIRYGTFLQFHPETIERILAPVFVRSRTWSIHLLHIIRLFDIILLKKDQRHFKVRYLLLYWFRITGNASFSLCAINEEGLRNPELTILYMHA
jgi:hypothetical protein